MNQTNSEIIPETTAITPPAYPEELLKYIEKYTWELQNYAFSLTRNHDTADDLYQDTIEKVLKDYWPWKSITNFVWWAQKIMKNTYIDNLRAEKRKPSTNSGSTDTKTIREIQDTLQSPWPGAIDDLSFQEIQEVINRLEEPYHTVFIMRVEGNLAYKEIAEQLGIKGPTARTTYSRAKDILREKLRRLWYQFP